jgi:hypothetical protein
MTRVAAVNLVESETRWCDALLRSVSWVNEGRDLEMRLSLAATAGDDLSEVLFSAQWVSELRLSLAYGHNVGGYPMTWEVTFVSTALQWHVRFDFGPQGETVVVNDSETAPSEDH